MSDQKIFPELIKNLPEADIPFSGVKGWISQSDDHQIVFMEIEPIGKVSEHTHGAQWGMVIEGEMELTIGGETKNYKNGNYYTVPANVPHSANFIKKTYVMDFFADRLRYKPKNSTT